MYEADWANRRKYALDNDFTKICHELDLSLRHLVQGHCKPFCC